MSLSVSVSSDSLASDFRSKTERKAQRSELAKKWHNEVLLAEKQGYPKLLSLVWSKSKDACGAVNKVDRNVIVVLRFGNKSSWWCVTCCDFSRLL